MSISSDARREANYRCKPTCPEVWTEVKYQVRELLLRADWLNESANLDTITNDITEVVMESLAKKGTDPLRAALIECEGERLKAQNELSDAKDEIKTLEKTLEDDAYDFNHTINGLERDIADLQGQLSDAEARISELEN